MAIDSIWAAAALLEDAAIGDEGEARQRTISRLVLHATGEAPYLQAPQIAEHALAGSVGLWHYRVAEAIMTLRIVLPLDHQLPPAAAR